MDVIYGLLEAHQSVLEGTELTTGPDLPLGGFPQIAADLPGGSFPYDLHILWLRSFLRMRPSALRGSDHIDKIRGQLVCRTKGIYLIPCA